METAGRGIQPRDVRDLCRFYGGDEYHDEGWRADVIVRLGADLSAGVPGMRGFPSATCATAA
jgi:hypothetical protein